MVSCPLHGPPSRPGGVLRYHAVLDRPLSAEELKERQRRLSMLSPHHVADAYRQAHGGVPDGR